jgi:peroxiredoxin
MAMRWDVLGWSTSLLVAVLLIAGCGQNSSPPTAEKPSEKRAEPALLPAEGEGAVATKSAPAPLPTDENPVKPAVATVDVAPVVPEASAPAPLPAAPRESIPLEESTESGKTMPQVHLSEQHAKTCLVRVGDMLPKFELTNLAGEKKPFGDLVGEKLSVVVFWDGREATALEELADLQRLVVERFEKDGVRVIGINKGDDPQLAAELVQQRGATFVNLSDRDGAAFAQVATERIPRTYLIDATGKILWFDMEYSRTTRQDLMAAIRYSLSR